MDSRLKNQTKQPQLYGYGLQSFYWFTDSESHSDVDSNLIDPWANTQYLSNEYSMSRIPYDLDFLNEKW